MRSIGLVEEGTVTLDYLRDKKPGRAKAAVEPREDTRESRGPRRPVRPVRFTEAV
jgi:hypothetical protein